jgi:hypothetical protein
VHITRHLSHLVAQMKVHITRHLVPQMKVHAAVYAAVKASHVRVVANCNAAMSQYFVAQAAGVWTRVFGAWRWRAAENCLRQWRLQMDEVVSAQMLEHHRQLNSCLNEYKTLNAARMLVGKIMEFKIAQMAEVAAYSLLNLPASPPPPPLNLSHGRPKHTYISKGNCSGCGF